MDMFSVRYRGRQIEVSLAAARELMKHAKTLADVKDILEKGYDAPRKRSEGVIERWLDEGRKTYNTVIAESYNDAAKEHVWVLIHFRKFTKRS